MQNKIQESLKVQAFFTSLLKVETRQPVLILWSIFKLYLDYFFVISLKMPHSMIYWK